jgi:RNA polymerase sigma factor (sigma-70 family)
VSSHTLDEILRRHRTALLKLARDWCRNQYDPEDLVQDVFLYATGHPFEVVNHPNPWNWLALVLWHRFLDRRRRTQTQGVQDGDPDEEQAKERPLTRWMDWEELEKAIQEIVRLRLEDLPFRVIADRLGFSIAKAHKRFLEACLLLAEHLKEKKKDF